VQCRGWAQSRRSTAASAARTLVRTWPEDWWPAGSEGDQKTVDVSWMGDLPGLHHVSPRIRDPRLLLRQRICRGRCGVEARAPVGVLALLLAVAAFWWARNTTAWTVVWRCHPQIR
jgi:hypothetical protein